MRLSPRNIPNDLDGLEKVTEDGYNTSGRPIDFDVKTDPNFTRDLLAGNVPLIDVGGSDYFEFLLDLNEPSHGQFSPISLDKLQIYSSDAGGKTTKILSDLGVLQYDLDGSGDSAVLLDYNVFNGSGYSDIRLLVPVWAGAEATDYIYFYSAFGWEDDGYRAEADFEEWSAREGRFLPPDDNGGGIDDVVPEPTSIAVWGIGLAVFVVFGRRSIRSKRSAA